MPGPEDWHNKTRKIKSLDNPSYADCFGEDTNVTTTSVGSAHTFEAAAHEFNVTYMASDYLYLKASFTHDDLEHWVVVELVKDKKGLEGNVYNKSNVNDPVATWTAEDGPPHGGCA